MKSFLVVVLLILSAGTNKAENVAASHDEDSNIVSMSPMKVVGFADQMDLFVAASGKENEVVTPTSKLAAVLILKVKPNSPAERAGIKPGMQLISAKLSNQKVQNLAQPRAGDLRVETVRERLTKLSTAEVTEADRQKGWIEMILVVSDDCIRGDKGIFTVPLRIKIKSEDPSNGLIGTK